MGESRKRRGGLFETTVFRFRILSIDIFSGSSSGVGLVNVVKRYESFMAKQRISRWALAALALTFLAVFFASQTYLSYKYSGGIAHAGVILKLNFGQWYLWGFAIPWIVWLARRFPVERKHWGRNAFLHFIVGVIISLVEWWLNNLFRNHILGLPGKVMLIYVFQQNFLTYWILVAGTQATGYYRSYREGEVRSAELSAQLAQAQLQALRMQLHPHFLFNTLNAISTLVHKDPEAADRMIAQLSDLLRLTLENMGVQEVPLAQELQFLERYLDIERTRFVDRLTVCMEIAPETLDASTPYLILQPIVENAIRHGIATRSSPGCVTISARREGNELILEVADNGPGLRTIAAPKDGVGLSSTRARLQKLYGTAHRLDFVNPERGGVLVRLVLPFRSIQPENEVSNHRAVLQ